MKIWFDLDGTIVNLYSVENWLNMLIAKDTTPYVIAKPLLNMNTLARKLNHLQKKGYEIGIISWLAKNSNAAYDEAVTNAKLKWLNKHLHSVKWDEINIVAYGTNKHKVCKMGILFDDEEKNRKEWGDASFEPSEIMKVLSVL